MNLREHSPAAKEPRTDSNGTSNGSALPYEVGLRHLRAGRYLDAQHCCQQALAADPDHADTLHLMGLVSLHAKQYDHAVEWISRAIRREPKPAYLTSLGATLLDQGRREEALQVFDKAIQLAPDNADLWRYLGSALAEVGRTDEAMLNFQHALKLAPRHFDAANRAAGLLQRSARFEDALVYLDLCLELRPDDVQTLHARWDALQRLGRREEAFTDIERAHALDPTNADITNNIGNALASLGRYEEAEPWYDRALALGGNAAHVLKNKAITLEQLGRIDEAIAAYQGAVFATPDDAGSAWNLALLQLLSGDFEAGWAGRETARWKIPTLVEGYPRLSRPVWRGAEPIDGKTILVCPDEGLGDVIQFARYVPMLAARGARVILIVQNELYPLLSKLAGVAQCLPRSATTAPPYDVHCPLSSLPLAFATRLDTVPAETSYLPAPPADRVAAWEQRLGSHDRLRVGLVWSGNPQHPNDRNRSMPFHIMARILDADATFVSLQKGPRAEDRPALQQRTNIIDLTDHLTDFVETAALVSCLDLVISVDTSVAHLSAALGRPTWILLPYAPDYRWLRDREDSPWYPTMRLFRQTETRDWKGALDSVRHELDRKIASFGRNSELTGMS
jgi:tetratricopeptide (TPR) repeat protein/ADP-heptose:LPS heptosyltransferase